MKKSIIIAVIACLCLIPLTAINQDKPAEKAAPPDTMKAAPADTTKAVAEKEITIDEYLIGQWTMAPHPGVLTGDITFKDDGTYDKNEKHEDGVGAGVKGQYILYKDQKPCGIDLCLEKCGGPGSEWTTLFGIVRILEDGRLEIRTSPDSKRPTEFNKEPGMYTMFLTRAEAEKKTEQKQ